MNEGKIDDVGTHAELMQRSRNIPRGISIPSRRGWRKWHRARMYSSAPWAAPAGAARAARAAVCPAQSPTDIKGSIKRLLGYMGAYKWYLLLVVALIALSSLAQVKGTSYLQGIVDYYLTPLASNFASTGLVDETLLSGFIKTLASMAFVYLFGALSTFAYARLMLEISTGTLLKLRTDLFDHMETLPIRYFDTHAHGDIMSRYARRRRCHPRDDVSTR